MLLGVTLNPAIDRVLAVEGFQVGESFRTAQVTAQAGGKGLNVVRAAHALGAPALATGPIAGSAGDYFAALAASEDFQGRWIPVEHGETRTATIIVHPPRDATVINECGPQLTPSDWQRISDELLQIARDAAIISFSGSLPGERSDTLAFATLVDHLIEAEHRLAIDTHSGALRAVIDRPLWLLKVNASELADAFDVPVGEEGTIIDLAVQVQARGAQVVLVTDGPRGAALVTRDACWWATPPVVEVVSSIGSGDTVLAGFCTAWLQHDSPAHALSELLRFAVAAGTANALTPVPGNIDREAVDRMAERIRVERRR